MEDRRKGQEVSWPGVPAGPLGIIRRWDLRGEGGRELKALTHEQDLPIIR